MSLKSKIESILFVSTKPISVKQISEVTKKDINEVKDACESLVAIYEKEKRGIHVIKNNSKYQMVSSPDNSKLVREYLKDESTRELSRPSMETLTIISYRSPISKIEIERIRGVNCSLILRNLMIRGLVELKFNKEKNDNYYSVTMDFIRHLGVSKLEELPDYEKLHNNEDIDRLLSDSLGEEGNVESINN